MLKELMERLEPYVTNDAEDVERSIDDFRFAVATRILEDLEESPNGAVKAEARRIMRQVRNVIRRSAKPLRDA